MKKVLSLILICMLAFSGCATVVPETDSPVTTAMELQETTTEEAKPYCIVYPAGDDSFVRQAAMDIWEYMKDFSDDVVIFTP